MTTLAESPVYTPFRVAVDQREQLPYSFEGLLADASQSHRPLVVVCENHHLETGDYSIVGMSDLVAIERKSLADLYTTLGQGRDRFEAEHQRLAGMSFAAVVIEATLEDTIRRPPDRSKLNPKTVYRTALSWPVRYGVHWMFCGSRRLAEVTTFRLLQQFHAQWTTPRNLEEKTHES